MIVRVAPDNDLIIDMESVIVNGQRYATHPNPIGSNRSRTIALWVRSLARFRADRPGVERMQYSTGLVLIARLEHSLDVGVADRGVDRDGKTLSRLVPLTAVSDPREPAPDRPSPSGAAPAQSWDLPPASLQPPAQHLDFRVIEERKTTYNRCA